MLPTEADAIKLASPEIEPEDANIPEPACDIPEVEQDDVDPDVTFFDGEDA